MKNKIKVGVSSQTVVSLMTADSNVDLNSDVDLDRDNSKINKPK